MYGHRYFAERFYPPRYFGEGASVAGGYFGHRYFGARRFPSRYFSPRAGTVVAGQNGYFGHRFFPIPFYGPRYFAPFGATVLEEPATSSGQATHVPVIRRPRFIKVEFVEPQDSARGSLRVLSVARAVATEGVDRVSGRAQALTRGRVRVFEPPDSLIASAAVSLRARAVAVEPQDRIRIKQRIAVSVRARISEPSDSVKGSAVTSWDDAAELDADELFILGIHGKD